MPVNINTRTRVTSRDFLRTWGNPEQQYALTQADRAYRYNRLWDIYQGTAFDNISDWSTYRRQFGLYRAIRQIWDHCYQLVEFYATHVWSGTLAADGLTLPDGVENAVPLAEDTDPKLALAIAQLWEWWNFQDQMTTIVRYTAALGELLVELVDDPERGKILINLVWPSYIKDVRLDESGNVIEYDIEYRVKNHDTGETYKYRRKVNKEFTQTFKDGEPYDYSRDQGRRQDWDRPYGEYVFGPDDELLDDDDDGSKIPNPWGFTPAVWFRHIKTVGVRGEPAIWSTQPQLDEANELFAHLLDKAHVSLEAPIVVSGNIAANSLQKAINQMAGTVKRAFTERLNETPVRERETINVLEGPQGTRVETIQIQIEDALKGLDRIVGSIEKKCPEITFYQELRSMTQITGPGAQRVLGDVERKVRSVASGYDRRLINLCQMGVSMAAMRFHGLVDDDEEADGWANPTDDQRKFEPFNADSYAEGDLDFDIIPRSVVPLNARDRLDLINLKKAALGDLIPTEVLALELGYQKQDVDRWVAEREKRQQEALTQTQSPGSQNGRTEPRRPVGAPPGGPQRGSERQRADPGPANALQRTGI